MKTVVRWSLLSLLVPVVFLVIGCAKPESASDTTTEAGPTTATTRVDKSAAESQ